MTEQEVRVLMRFIGYYMLLMTLTGFFAGAIVYRDKIPCSLLAVSYLALVILIFLCLLNIKTILKLTSRIFKGKK